MSFVGFKGANMQGTKNEGSIRVAVIGASGYTGAELLRILWEHPFFEVKIVTAMRYKGELVGNLYPSLGKYYPTEYSPYELDLVEEEADVVFLGVPHGEGMKYLPELASAGKKVVDLSADFRFADEQVYEGIYGKQHTATEYLGKIPYGLAELNRERIKKSSLVANPGCYATAALIGLFPAFESGIAGGAVMVDAKSGISGAGRELTLNTHFPQAADNFSAYAVARHRHQPEIECELGLLLGIPNPKVVMVPHLSPMNRGILCTTYVPLKEYPLTRGEIAELYEKAYGKENFIVLLGEGRYPETKSVQGTNDCHLAVEVSEDGEMLIVITAIDNLVKGAAGQAVQNMNLFCGLPEQTGLERPGLFR
ncbi:MAG: N-acetyl-gamma-glutamyl-phosphate reductase [Actinomycetota bacterium]|nr:N-acetyl-gamma-glutamyl-phosphate reductase [Actinomycetota bacterium]